MTYSRFWRISSFGTVHPSICARTTGRSSLRESIPKLVETGATSVSGDSM